MELLSTSRSFGGEQRIYRHMSKITGTPMRLAVFVPPQAAQGVVPVVWYLSGLTCNEENFTVKAGAQRMAAELGLMLVAPDTSPRGEGVPDDANYDFGQGAGFYVDAIQAPWNEHFKMDSYITKELPQLIEQHLPADMSKQSIMGHSMGGHGAISLALRNPGRYVSVSALAPLASPMASAWGQKALKGYLGEDLGAWKAYDACALLRQGANIPGLLVDQGVDDAFVNQLQPKLLEEACREAGVLLRLRMQEGYDHSYFFVASFIDDHLRYHAARLAGVDVGPALDALA